MTIEGNQFELNIAIQTLADRFDTMLLGPESTFASFTCEEFDALWAVLDRAGRHATAQAMLEAHAEGDEEGDAHWLGPKKEET